MPLLCTMYTMSNGFMLCHDAAGERAVCVWEETGPAPEGHWEVITSVPEELLATLPDGERSRIEKWLGGAPG